MRLTVLGATGGVGRHIVRHALDDGHQVTALVRDPAKLGIDHPGLTVVTGSALDPAAIEPALDGADALLSGMGAGSRKDPLNPASNSAGAAIDAMKATGVRRIVTVSAAPLNRTGDGQTLLARTVFARLLWAVLGDVYRDLERMERHLADSGLDWTAVRPPKLHDKPGTGRYRKLVDAGPPGNSIARADVASAMLDFVTDESTIGHAVGVSA